MPPWEVFPENGRERPGGVVCGPVGEKPALVQGLAWPEGQAGCVVTLYSSAPASEGPGPGWGVLDVTVYVSGHLEVWVLLNSPWPFVSTSCVSRVCGVLWGVPCVPMQSPPSWKSTQTAAKDQRLTRGQQQPRVPATQEASTPDRAKLGLLWGLRHQGTHLPMREMGVWSLGREDPLEKEMATYSSIPAWTIPCAEGPGGLQSTGLKRSWRKEDKTRLSDGAGMLQILAPLQTVLQAFVFFEFQTSFRRLSRRIGCWVSFFQLSALLSVDPNLLLRSRSLFGGPPFQCRCCRNSFSQFP